MPCPSPAFPRAVASAAGLILAASSLALAQTPEFPVKPVRWIVPFAPGGSADAVARAIQPALAEVSGQPWIIDNRGGASGIIGSELMLKAPPDGHTQLLITTTHTINPSLMKLPFDPVKDFAPVSLLMSQPNILVVHPSVPAKSVKELVALARARPDALSYGSAGNGSSPHLSGELLKLVANVRVTHVPYKSAGPAVGDLLGGHLSMMFAGPLAVESFVKSGRLRALAVADSRRSAVVPEVPTMAEAGFAGVETGTWFGLTVHPATTRPIIAAANGIVVRALSSRDLRAKLAAIGVDTIASTPEAFGTHIVAEIAKWSQVIKRSAIKAD
ncbi:MAG: tripartite tricarboxylate transporter substrate binding protein [Pseudomonadota bacterium]